MIILGIFIGFIISCIVYYFIIKYKLKIIKENQSIKLINQKLKEETAIYTTKKEELISNIHSLEIQS